MSELLKSTSQNEVPQPEEELMAGKLQVQIYPDRPSMGAAAAETVAAWMREVIATKGVVNMIFAAAPSQNEFLAALAAIEDLDWSRVVVMNMDEYVNLSPEAPQGFGHFLGQHLWDQVNPSEIHRLDISTTNPKAECERYTQILNVAKVLDLYSLLTIVTNMLKYICLLLVRVIRPNHKPKASIKTQIRVFFKFFEDCFSYFLPQILIFSRQG